MPLLDELGTYLQGQGVGTLGLSLFQGPLPLDELPLSAVPLVGVIPVPGLAPVQAHGLTLYEQPVVQIVVCGVPHELEAALAKAQEAWTALVAVHNTTLSGVSYLWCQALHSPFYLKTDVYHRPFIVFSVRCARSL